MLEFNRNPSRRELRQFAGIWLPAFFALVGGLILYKTGHVLLPIVLWTPALLLSVMGLVKPAWIRPVYIVWMFAAAPIGWLMSRLILAIVYYLVLTPIGLMLRLVKPDLLQERFDSSAATYWVKREPARDTSRYFRQF
jgi:hypothetical protein